MRRHDAARPACACVGMSPLLGTPQGLSVFVDGVRVNGRGAVT
ncbi:hypothetical protein [Burkholderia lata]